MIHYQMFWILLLFKKIKCFPHPSSPWYNSTLSNLKRNLRKLVKRYLHEPNSINCCEFKDMRLIYRKSLLSAKPSFFQDKILNCVNDISFIFHLLILYIIIVLLNLYHHILISICAIFL